LRVLIWKGVVVWRKWLIGAGRVIPSGSHVLVENLERKGLFDLGDERSNI